MFEALGKFVIWLISLVPKLLTSLEPKFKSAQEHSKRMSDKFLKHVEKKITEKLTDTISKGEEELYRTIHKGKKKRQSEFHWHDNTRRGAVSRKEGIDHSKIRGHQVLVDHNPKYGSIIGNLGTEISDLADQIETTRVRLSDESGPSSLADMERRLANGRVRKGDLHYLEQAGIITSVDIESILGEFDD